MQWLVEGGWKAILVVEAAIFVVWLALGVLASLRGRVRAAGGLAIVGALLAVAAVTVGLLVAREISLENAILYREGVTVPPRTVKDPLLWATVVGTFYAGFAIVFTVSALYHARLKHQVDAQR